MSFVNVKGYHINTSKIFYYFQDGDEVIVHFNSDFYLPIEISLEEFEKICFGKGEDYFYPPLG
jgi:hypothetical protein